LLFLYTFLPSEQIEELTSVSGEALREAKRTLAFESTALTHGIEAANEAQETANRLFTGTRGGHLDASDESLPTVVISITEAHSLTIADLFIRAGLASSRGDARRVAGQGGLSIDEERVTEVDTPVGDTHPRILRACKKRFMRIAFAD
jgi:tyrosyl-tRNA synthetase